MTSKRSFRRLGLAVVAGCLTGLSLTAQPALPVAARAQPVPPSGDGPQIEFLETKHEFGRVSAGEIIRQNFAFKNTGNRPLEIRSVQPSCGCTTAGEWSKIVAPGQTGAIPIQLSTTNFKGPIHKTVTVVSSALNSPVTTLYLNGEVWVPVSLNPPYLYFSLVTGRAEAASRTARIQNNTDEPMEILGVESSSDSIQAEVRTITPGKEYELVASVNGKLSAVSSQGTVKIKTSAKESPVLEVKVYAHMQDPIVATPSHLILPAGPLPGAVKRYVTVRSNETEPLSIDPPELIGVENVEVAVTETLKGRMFRIELVFPAGFDLEAGKEAMVKVHTSNQDFPEFTLPVIQPQQAVRAPLAARQAPPPPPSATVVPPLTPAPKPPPPTFDSPVPSLLPDSDAPPLPPAPVAPLPPKSN